MRRLLSALFLCVCCGLCPPLAAQDAPKTATLPVVVRESLDPASGAVIGQHVALRIDVLFRGIMPHPPRVTLPEIGGVQALDFESQGTSLRETIGGESYVGQRFEFALYARRGGAFDIRPARVTLLDRADDVTGTVQGQGITLSVSVPPGVDPSGPVIATTALTLDENWEPALNSAFRSGDAIVRTVTRTAEDVPGLAMRNLHFIAPEGVRAYVDPPRIDDQSDRGFVTGRRVDRVTYVFERGGTVKLPAASQAWWDLSSGTLKSAMAAGADIKVVVPPPSRSARGVPVGLWLLAALGAGLLLIGGLLARYLIKRQRATGAYAERVAFAALRRACAGADARATYHAFWRWRSLLEPARQREATQAATALETALFAAASPFWQIGAARHLITRLAELRRPDAAVTRWVPLPPLNPEGDITTKTTSPRGV